MSDKTGIEWTDATHNFWYGCAKVSAGCKHCYAERDMTKYGRDFGVVTVAKGFDKPLSWREPRRVFVNSWSDFFIEVISDQVRDRAWDIIRRTPHLTYQILTKRPNSIHDMLPEDWGDEGYPNVWLGVSVENPAQGWRLIALEEIPARVKFLSAEPLLCSIRGVVTTFSPTLDWVITGGESGPNARPANPDWFREVRDECQAGGIAYFHKQNGGTGRIDGHWGGRLLDGRTWGEFPDVPAEPAEPVIAQTRMFEVAP